jgi:LCP family protein required for cell wall assembly
VLPGTAPKRGRRFTRVLSWIAVITSLSVLTAAGTGYVLLNKYDGNIDRIGGVLDLPGVERPAEGPRSAQNILLVGSDSREGLAPGEGTQGRGDTFVTGQRADTIILAHLYGGSDKAQLISFPRDSYVDIPAYTNPETGETVPAHKGKINSSFTAGGPALLVATIEQLTNVRIDNYVQIDFDGFRSIVDRLGGVEVCLSKPAKDKDSGINLPAGRQVISGDQALAFVRQRRGLPQGDIDRIRRQQQFLGSVIRKTLSAGTLLNPLKLNGFLDATTQSLQVDESLSVGDLRDLALRFRDMNAGGVTFTTVPIADNAGRTSRGESVVLLDEVAAELLFEQIRRDIPPDTPAVPDDAPGGDNPLIVPPSDVRVQVFNGAGIDGLGRRVADDLEQAGFQLAGVPENRGTDAATTTVLHGPDRADSARTLAAALPGAKVELDPTLGRTLEVVVGSDYDGVTRVSVSPAAPSPSAAPTGDTPAPPPVTTAAEDPCAP